LALDSVGTDPPSYTLFGSGSAGLGSISGVQDAPHGRVGDAGQKAKLGKLLRDAMTVSTEARKLAPILVADLIGYSRLAGGA
jgi:hypothetical protein